MSATARALLEKIEALPPERRVEVEDFVEFVRLREQERALTRAAAAASAPGFAAVWNNPDDDAYDALWVRRYRAGAVSVRQSGGGEAAARRGRQQPGIQWRSA